MTWKLDVSDACIGSGMCTAIAPERFDLSKGYSEPVNPDVDEDSTVLDAAEACPASAIRVVDASGDVLAPAE